MGRAKGERRMERSEGGEGKKGEEKDEGWEERG